MENNSLLRSFSSPFSKFNRQVGNDNFFPSVTRASSDSGGMRQQPRNSRSTDSRAENLSSSSRMEDELEESSCGPGAVQKKRRKDENALKPARVSYKKLWSFATPLDYVLVIIGALAAIAHGVVLPLSLALLGRVVDAFGAHQFNEERAFQMVCQISLIFVYIAVASIWIHWLEVTCWMSTGERQAVQIRERYLKALLSRDLSFFDTELARTNGSIDVGATMSNDVMAIQEALGEKVTNILLNISIFVAGIAVALIQCWQVALLTLCFVPLLVGTDITYKRAYAKLLVKAQASIEAASSIGKEAISQVRTVYAVVGESRAVKLFSKALKTSAKLGMQGSLAKGIGMGLSLGITQLTWASALRFGEVLIRKGKTNGGAILATMFCIIYSGMALGQALPELQVFVRGRIAGYKVFQVIDLEVKQDSSDCGTLALVRGEIEFRSVHFSYPSRPKVPIVSDLSLTVNAGETVALVGNRGSGRNTLLMLIQRLYTPNLGEVLLDGVDIKTLQLQWLRRHIGFAGQEAVIFSGTIKQNILYGKPAGCTADAEAAAVAVNAHSFISKLPCGYETLVGEFGIRLSETQKQWIALARAIVNTPAVLLLDEAMSSLDAQSEHQLYQAVQSTMQGRTIIIVTHRISTARAADTIAVLDKGKVVETGSHAQLLGRGHLSLYVSFLRLEESRPLKQNDGSATMYQGGILFGSVGSSPPRSSFQSGASSPLASLLQSPDSPSSRCSESQNTSTPDSPVLELPPSPATPPGAMRQNTEGMLEQARVHEETLSVDRCPLKSMFKLLSGECLSAMAGGLAAVTTGSVSPVVMLLLMNVVEILYSSSSKQLKMVEGRGNTFCVVIAGLGGLSVVTGIAQHCFFGRAGGRVANRARENAFRAKMTNEIGWFDLETHSSSVLTAKIASCGTVMNVAFSDRASMCLQYFTSIAVAITLAFVIEWKIAAVTVILIPFTMIGGYVKSIFVEEGFAGNLERSHRMASRLAMEAISNVKMIAAYCVEDQIILQLRHCLKVTSEKQAWRAHRGGLLFGISHAGMYAANSLVLWYIAVMVKKRHSQPWPALKVYQIIACTGFLLAEACRLLPEMKKGVAATKSLLAMVNRKTQIDSDSADALQPYEVAGHIEYEDVTFCYPAKPSNVVLNDINLLVPAGHTIALVGPSGCGKSTILALLERFYDPAFGRILLDGLDIKLLNLKWLRKHIGYVQQEPALFALSIRDNILYGNETMSEAEMIEAARKANAHGFISSLPLAYDTRVGEGGVHLSASQKQRLAIARAVMQNPKVLLLDDATNCLDFEAEKVVQDALDNVMLEGERRTTFFIAHRFTNIQMADKIVYIKNGQIRETGSHSSLMALDGAYATLVEAQHSAPT